MRIGRIILVSGALALAALLAATAWLAGTEAGLRFLLARTSAMVPGTLEVGMVRGRLVGPMVLGDVRWTRDDTGAAAAAIELDWQPLGLLRREIRLHRLDLQDVVVDLPAADAGGPEDGAPAGDWQDLALPWGIAVREVDIDRARIRRGGELLGEIHGLRGELRAGRQTLVLETLEFSSPQGDASGRLAVSLDPHEPWDVDLAWAVRLPDVALAGTTRITGTLPELDLRQRFSQPVAAEVSGRLRGLPDKPDWDLRVQLQPLPSGDNPWPEALEGVSADVTVVGSIETSTIRGAIAWPAVLEATAAVDATLGWREAVLVLDSVAVALDENSRLQARGRVVPGTTPQVELQGTATGITWPLQGPGVLATVPQLEFDGSATGSAWRLAARGEVVAADLPAAVVALQAQGDASSLRVDGLKAEVLGGTVTGTGSARWQDVSSLAFDLQLAELDPSVLAPAWPGRVGGTVHVEGSLGPGQRIRVEGHDITGQLRSQPLAGAFRLVWAEHSLEIDASRLSLGSASIEASGTVSDESIDLRARIDAPRLEELGPGITGRISARAQVAGARAAPRIELQAEGGRLSWGTLRARMLQADASVDLTGASASKIRAELAGISARPGRSATLRLEAAGRPEDHAIQLEFTRRRPEQGLVMALAGKLDGAAWSGQLSELEVREAQQVLWQLQAPASLSVSPDNMQLSQACMDGVLGRLCLEAERRGTAPRWLGEAELVRLDLGPLSEWLGLGLTARGEVTGSARLAAAGDRFRELDGAFRLSSGDIRRRDRRDDTLLAWTLGELNLGGDAEAAEATLDLALADENRIQGRLRTGWNQPDPWLEGTLEAELDRLDLVTELVPELSALGGKLGISLSLAGTLSAPEPGGRFEWRDGNAAIPELGITPHDIQLQAAIAQGMLNFEATGRSGEGSFEATGEFDLKAPGVDGQASLRGENLTVANLPDVVVVAEPALRFGFRGDRLNIGGRVHIPSALISGLGTGGAVRVSPDEVIVGERAAVAGNGSGGVVVSSRIEVSAGPSVQLQIAGFRGRVEGRVLTVVQPDADPWGRGELRVVDGEMSVLGQTLVIDTGRLIYDGGPLEDPGLEIRAVRKVRDVTAGALVRGTAQQPQVSIFSEPPMSNAEALSYLTLGKSLEQIQSGERQTMNQAANALALSGGGVVMQDLARRLGVEGLEVSAETGDNGSALVVSKYLGGGLYVSYGLGLFDTVNTVRLRYQFNRRLSLEAESGEESSADLFYSFERK